MPLQIASPSPVPVARVLLESWTCENFWKSSGSLSGAIPCPLSSTRTVASSASCSTLILIGAAADENLAALVSRFVSTWTSRRLSAFTAGISSGMSTSIRCDRPLRTKIDCASSTTRAEVDRLRLDGQRTGFDAAHVEQVVREVAQPVGLLIDDLEELPRLLGIERPRAAERRRRGALDGRQRRLQLVRHHAQELAAQPLQVFHRLHAFGYVADYALNGDDLAVFVVDRGVVMLDPDRRAVPVVAAQDDRPRQHAGGCPHLVDERLVVRMHDLVVEIGVGKPLLALVAEERRHRGADVLVARRVEAEAVDAVGGVLRQQPEAFLALLQLFLDLPLVRDLHDLHEVSARAILVPHAQRRQDDGQVDDA